MKKDELIICKDYFKKYALKNNEALMVRGGGDDSEDKPPPTP